MGRQSISRTAPSERMTDDLPFHQPCTGARHTMWTVVSGIHVARDMAIDDEHICVTAMRGNELVLVERRNCAIMRRRPVGEAPCAVTCDRGWLRVSFGLTPRHGAVATIEGSSETVLVHLVGTKHIPYLEPMTLLRTGCEVWCT